MNQIYLEEITRLLKRFYSDQLTEEERNSLYKILNTEDESTIDAVLGKVWINCKPSENEDVHAALAIVKQKLAISSDEPGKLRNETLQRYFLQVVKYAAIILITAGVTWLASTYHTPVKKSNPEAFNEIVVPKGSRSTITLADGTHVWLNSGSRLKYPSGFSGLTREIYLEGEAYFDVTHKDNQLFIVKTSNLKIKVFGTKFNVKAFPEDKTIETALVVGSVAIEAIGKDGQPDQLLNIKPSEVASYSRLTGKLRILPTINLKSPGSSTRGVEKMEVVEARKVERIKSITAWKENKLVFRRESIDNLIIKLERWYGVSIKLRNSELQKYSYTGTFENETIEQALNALKLAYPFNYTIAKNVIEITPR
jgi:transmembrane sensor